MQICCIFKTIKYHTRGTKTHFQPKKAAIEHNRKSNTKRNVNEWNKSWIAYVLCTKITHTRDARQRIESKYYWHGARYKWEKQCHKINYHMSRLFLIISRDFSCSVTRFDRRRLQYQIINTTRFVNASEAPLQLHSSIMAEMEQLETIANRMSLNKIETSDESDENH